MVSVWQMQHSSTVRAAAFGPELETCAAFSSFLINYLKPFAPMLCDGASSQLYCSCVACLPQLLLRCAETIVQEPLTRIDPVSSFLQKRSSCTTRGNTMSQ